MTNYLVITLLMLYPLASLAEDNVFDMLTPTGHSYTKSLTNGGLNLTVHYLANQTVTNSETIGHIVKDCRFDHADLNPLRTDNGDRYVEYGCRGGVCVLIQNFCRPTLSTCNGRNALFIALVKNTDIGICVFDNWDEADWDLAGCTYNEKDWYYGVRIMSRQVAAQVIMCAEPYHLEFRAVMNLKGITSPVWLSQFTYIR